MSQTSIYPKFFILAAAFALSAASYASVDYHGQTISGLHFTDDQYNAEDFSNSDFSGVTATDTVFSSASVKRNFSGSNFSDSSLRGAIFNYGNLSNADFASSDLTHGYFTGANLRGAIFTDAIIDDVAFTGAVQNGFTAEQLYSTKSYNDKSLTYVDFDGNDLSGWNFSGQNLTRANFSIAKLWNVDFQEANLTNAIFDYSDLSGADFRGSSGASFSGSILANTILADGSVNGGAVSLSGSDKSLVIRPSDSSAVKMTASGSVSDGAALIFKGKSSSSDNALIEVSGEGVSFDLSGCKLEVYLSEDFDPQSELFFALIDASDGGTIVAGGLSKDDVSMFNHDGSIFSGKWDLSISDSSLGIMVGIPEPACTALLFVFAVVACVVMRKRIPR